VTSLGARTLSDIYKKMLLTNAGRSAHSMSDQVIRAGDRHGRIGIYGHPTSSTSRCRPLNYTKGSRRLLENKPTGQSALLRVPMAKAGEPLAWHVIRRLANSSGGANSMTGGMRAIQSFKTCANRPCSTIVRFSPASGIRRYVLSAVL